MNKIKLRRIRRLLSTNKFKLIMFIMVSLLLFTSTGYAILNVVQRIDGTATIWVDSEFVCQSGISGTYQTNASWGEGNGRTHYNATITINNDGSEDILTWEIVLKGPSDLEVQTNADIVIDDSGIVTMTPLSWNSLITSGNHVILDVGFITVEEDFAPEYIYINGCLVYGTDVGGSGGGNGSGEEDDDNGDPTVELTGLEISPSTYSMSVGETAPLQVTKTPSDAFATLVWSSSDENIATVNESGVVRAVSKGEVVITVTNGTISAQSIITIEEPTTELTALSITPASYTMTVDEKVVLQVTKTPSDSSATLTWSSDNESVATVAQDGTVTAIGVGDAVITVTNGEISAQSVITVEEAVPPSDVDDVSIEFVTNGNPWGSLEYGYSANFEINITNNSENAINELSFTIGFPEGTSLTIWNNAVTVNGTEITYTATLASNGSIKLQGQLSLPVNYEINDYLPPVITINEVK